ncbi:MAG TPA: response regulator [Steroidobacteraceae bacterium]|jgi:signal transduction histidine kinase/ActR/RegA family two-component response regulator/HAMP domain-containing protein|nr:response regulator [Steroidobacteraceae bacterium]
MPLRNLPIRRKLMAMLLVTTGAVLAVTCAAFIAYQYVAYRGAARHTVQTLGDVIASNSTAAVAFDNATDETDVLAALHAERRVIGAAVYDASGALFAHYPASASASAFPPHPKHDGLRFDDGMLLYYRPIRQGDNTRLGTLYLRWDLASLHRAIAVYALIAAGLTAFAMLLAYLLGRSLREQISIPVQTLGRVALAVSEKRDYTVRAPKLGNDELGTLTDAFNHMLDQLTADIAERKMSGARLQQQLSRLDLLHRITRAVGERQDLRSIFQVVIRHLEEHVPIEFGCICLYDPGEEMLTVTSVGAQSRETALELALTEKARIAVDRNGLSRCVSGELVYEPDIASSPFPFPGTLAKGGLRALVIAPLRAESRVFGILVAARREPESFSSGDCEFLRQLSEHVALAAHQAQLYDALQRAYEELRQSQESVVQQERLRALGQMASGVAHDINNAISPIALYTESLLEREPGLSDRARAYLTTIQTAIHDVARTVSRMREFYRHQEVLAPVARLDLDRIIRGVLELTQARWRDLPQERGAVIELHTDLVNPPAVIMGAENEIRDALTNLIFNAADAMPDGGTLTLRTKRLVRQAQREPHAPAAEETPAEMVCLEVADTGAGMSEEVRRRCLEPFFTTKGERGTGMGLAMVYGMAQRHGAQIEIDSAPGQGTTIRLLFRAAPLAADETGRQLALGLPVRPMRILIVDDDPLIIESLRETLRGDGHRVTAAEGGQAGIDAFEAARASGEPFELVITDLGMPYVDGRRVAAAIKAASPSTPVVLLTGWGQRLIAESQVPPHVDRVVNKPPKMRELRAALAELARAR